MKKENRVMKWMKSAMDIGTFLMSLIFACFLFSFIYFGIFGSASDRSIQQHITIFDRPSRVPEENNISVSQEMVDRPSRVPEENNISASQEIVDRTSRVHEENNRSVTLEIVDRPSSVPEENNILVSQEIGKEIEPVHKLIKPSCTSNYLSAVCEIHGDQVRINGNLSTVFFTSNSELNETWLIQPYPRKYDTGMMKSIPNVTITQLYGPEETSKCTIDHNITAVIFAIGGYTGNFYHDFNDVLVPLFVTSRQFEGEVQFFISNMQPWWVGKYTQILSKLSKYEIIDFNKENNVYCYPRVIVGLYSNKDLSMDPSITPNNYSMVDFAKFMRTVYSLERDFPIRLQENTGKKPRLLIIPRKHSRRLTNVDEVVRVAEELGFEVVAGEAEFDTNVGDFARVVNSFDVLMGVHGAGLTNSIFLPTNAVFIQIVPFGNLEWMCEHAFGEPARDMQLNYMQYNITEEESTLNEKYSRDDRCLETPIVFTRKDGMLWPAFILANKVSD